MSGQQENFEICKRCKTGSVKCANDDSDEAHKLKGFTLRGPVYLPAPTQEPLPFDSRIMRAIKNNDKALITRLARNKYVIDERNEECLSILLQRNPEIDVKFAACTPLTEACRQGNTNCAKLLLDAGADPNFEYWVPEFSPLVSPQKKMIVP